MNPSATPEEVNLSQFWRTTWSVWRSGALSAISEIYACDAKKDFDDFIKKSTDVKNPLITNFFTAHQPRQQEFLMCVFIRKNRVSMVLTNMRFWLQDMKTHEYVCLELADISQLQTNFTGSRVTVRHKDSTEHTYNHVCAPSDEALALALELCANPESCATGSSPNANQTPSRAATIKRIWEVRFADGSIKTYGEQNDIIEAIMTGDVRGDSECRQVKLGANAEGKTEARWKSVQRSFDIFRPIRGYMAKGGMIGLWIGVMLFFAFGAFNATVAGIRIQAHNASAKCVGLAFGCLFWLACSLSGIAQAMPESKKRIVQKISGKVIQGVIMLAILFTVQNGSGVLNGLMLGLGGAFPIFIIGSVFGGLPGIAIGTVVGLVAVRPFGFLQGHGKKA